MIRETVRNDLMVYLHDLGCVNNHKPTQPPCPYYDLRPATLVDMAEEVAMHMHDALCDEGHPYSFHGDNPDDGMWTELGQQIVLETAKEAIRAERG